MKPTLQSGFPDHWRTDDAAAFPKMNRLNETRFLKEPYGQYQNHWDYLFARRHRVKPKDPLQPDNHPNDLRWHSLSTNE